MTPAFALALCLISAVFAVLSGLALWVASGMRDDLREVRRTLERLVERVGEHDAFISALKLKMTEESKR